MIAREIAGVKAVAPQASSAATAIYDGANWSTHDQRHHQRDYFQVQPWPLRPRRPEPGLAPRKKRPAKQRLHPGQHGGDAEPVSATRTGGRQGGCGSARSPATSSAPCSTRKGRHRLRRRPGRHHRGDADQARCSVALRGNRDIRLMLVGVDPAYDPCAAVQSAIQTNCCASAAEHPRRARDDDFNIFDTAADQVTPCPPRPPTLLTRIVTAVASDQRWLSAASAS